jgi:ribonuclease HII
METAVSLTRRFESERTERLRLSTMLNFVRVLWKSGAQDIAGVDEVGIGPLARPVIAAAVMFAPDVEITGVHKRPMAYGGRRSWLVLI